MGNQTERDRLIGLLWEETSGDSLGFRSVCEEVADVLLAAGYRCHAEPVVWHDEASRFAESGHLDPVDSCLCPISDEAVAKIKSYGVTEFVSRLQVTYRKLSSNGVYEVAQLAVDEFGADPEELGVTHIILPYMRGVEGRND